MQFGLLGPLVVATTGGTTEIAGERQRRLLGALLLSPGRPISAERLVEIAWCGQEPPAAALNSLRVYVSRLRQALGDADLIPHREAGYVLEIDGHDVDSAQFESLVRQAERSSMPSEREELLVRALGLWRGPVLGELGDEWWALNEASRLDEVRAAATEHLARVRLETGRVTGLVADLEPALVSWPRRDRLRALHMRALYRLGREADALASFQAHRAYLAETTGLEPGAELVELEQRILVRDPSLLVFEPRDQKLRGYRLIEVIGEGAFSLVYRGTQPSVERDVAIKQIRAELANRPQFIRRFEAEAQTVARLEHPHIVPLYDYWREPDTAYLVMRWLRGGTLEQHLAGCVLTVDEAVRLLRQIGGALAAAHRSDVVHRDVKSANVYLDGDGNYFLGDFGIAVGATEHDDPSAALSPGSAAYASPEQLLRAPIGPTADVHGLAITAFEALTGQLPFPAEVSQAALLQRQLHDPIPPVRALRSDLPHRVDDVLGRATAKSPLDRYQTVEDFVADFVVAVDGPGTTSVPPLGGATVLSIDAGRNPYRGLRAYQRADADEFFGRERLVDELVGILARPGSAGRLVTVVGPSGSGKSSVVRAGLVPALERGAVPGSASWFVTTMAPGSNPFDELETALLRVAVNPPEQLLGQLTADARGIGRSVRRVLPSDDDELVLVVDQLEELFTLVDGDQRRAFLEGLARAVTDPSSQLRVVLTLRADFYDRPLRHAEIAALIKDSAVTVAPLAPDELEAAIVMPAAQLGAEFEPGLVSEIVADVADQPGALPMMQYALTEVWERRASGLLTRTAYLELGGVAGAVPARAEELYASLTAEQQETLRHVVGRLVSLGEGVQDTRRRALRSELGTSSDVDAVLTTFGDARLLSFDHDEATREPTVEVAHEALIREWPRLQGWLEEDREDLRILRHLHAAAADWDAGGRPAGDLYRGGRLEAAETWAARHVDELTEVECAFVRAAIEERDRRTLAEEAQRAGERRTNRRLRGLLVGVAVALVLALVAGFIALRLRGDAEDTAYAAETSRLVAQSASFADSSPRLAALLALAAHERQQRDESPAELGALQTALVGAAPLLSLVGWGTSYQHVELLSNDRIIGVRTDGVDLYDGTTGELLDSEAIAFGAPFGQHDQGDPFSVASASEAPMFVAADRDGGDVVLYEAGDAIVVRRRWTLEAMPLQVAIDAAGERVAASDTQLRLYGWASSGDPLFEPRASEVAPGTWADALRPQLGDAPMVWNVYEAIPNFVGVTPVGDALLVVEGPFASLYGWDGTRLAGPSVPLIESAFGRLTVVGSSSPVLDDSGSIHVFGVDSVYTLPADGDWPERVEASWLPGMAGRTTPDLVGVVGTRDGAVLVTNDGQVHSFAAGRLDPAPSSVDLEARAAAFDDERVAIATTEGIYVLSRHAAGPISSPFARPADAPDASVSRDGEFVVAGPTPEGGSLVVWQADTKRTVDVSEAVAAPLGAWMSPDDRLRVGGLDEEGRFVVDLFDVGDDAVERYVRFGAPLPLVYSEDVKDDVLALLTAGNVTSIIDNTTGEVLLTLPQPSDAVDVAFHPTRNWLLVGSRSGEPILYDTTSWEIVTDVDLSEETISAGQWSLDGELLATVAFGDGIDIRDGATFEILRHIDLPSVAAEERNNASLVFSEDNTVLLTNVDGPGRLWDVATGEPIGEPFPGDRFSISGVNFGEHPQLVTVNEQAVLLWNLDTGSWPDIACRMAGSNLTSSEWEQWGPRDENYRALCPQWPSGR